MIHALTTQGNPAVPLCGVNDGLAVEVVHQWERSKVDCPDCLAAMTNRLSLNHWLGAVDTLLQARWMTTARRYPRVYIDRRNIDRWLKRYERGLTPEQAVNERLENR